MKSGWGRGWAGTGPLKTALQGLAESGAQGQDLEGLLDAAQGDVEGVGVLGF